MVNFHDREVTIVWFYYLPSQATIMSDTPITCLLKTNQKE